MASAETNVLFIGGPNTGKSTYLVQLYGRMRAGTCWLRSREAPENLAAVQEGLARLNRGLPLRHTPEQTHLLQKLPVRSEDGGSLDLILPEYAGEALRKLVTTRQICQQWQALIQRSQHWLLFLRLERAIRQQDIFSKPFKEILTTTGYANAQHRAVVRDLPPDLWHVELLQLMLHVSHNRSRTERRDPYLTILLSCWDEMNIEDSVSPREVLAERLPLLCSFLESTWSSLALEIVGLSAQGTALGTTENSDFVSKGPERMGWVVKTNGERSSDLTLPLAQR